MLHAFKSTTNCQNCIVHDAKNTFSTLIFIGLTLTGSPNFTLLAYMLKYSKSTNEAYVLQTLKIASFTTRKTRFRHFSSLVLHLLIVQISLYSRICWSTVSLRMKLMYLLSFAKELPVLNFTQSFLWPRCLMTRPVTTGKCTTGNSQLTSILFNAE
jgi:hypothetical protein